MTQGINDNMLGSRFWLVNDFQPLQQNDNASNVAVAPGRQRHPAINVKHDSTVFSFVTNGGDAMVKSAINKAEIFAASHTLTEDERNQETVKANNNKQYLLGDEDAVAEFMEEVNAIYADKFGQDGANFCATALNKLMVTREFDERAKIAQSNNQVLAGAGLDSLKNAVLGLARMLQEGKISEDAVVILSDSNIYDASNKADLLRLVADSAQKTRELFIGEKRFNALIQQCENLLRDNRQQLTQQDIQAITAMIAELRTLANVAITCRRLASSGIKTDYKFTDDTGKVKSDSDFQEKQIKQIRESLRAFRYDLDQRRGTSMKKMERMRRYFDDKFSSYSGTRIGLAMYTQMQDADNRFNEKLRQIQTRILGHAAPEPQLDANDPYAGTTGEVALGDKINLNASAKAATHLSHLTNDRIRYHRSGAEERAKANAKAIKNELGDIAKSGGERTVTFRAGVDFLFDLNLGFAEADAKAGFTGKVSAQISVNNNDGTVSVTYSGGADLHAKAGVTLGVDRDKEGDNLKGGLGANIGAGASLEVQRSVTKTYANLDEFIRTATKYNLVMTPRPREVFYAWAPRLVKGLGHLFMLGSTALGFRISKSKMDQVSYGAELRNRNVFGPMSGLFLKKRNVEVLGERKATAFSGSAKGTAEAGVFYANNGKYDSNIEFGGSLGISHSREYFVKNTIYVSFAKSLKTCSDGFLRQRFNSELDNQVDFLPQNDPWRMSIKELVEGTDVQPPAEHYDAGRIAPSFARLTTMLHELEESAAKTAQKDNAFWNQFAAKARILAVAVALLAKRAEALEGVDPQTVAAKKAAEAASRYIIPRIANPIVKLPHKIYQEKFFNVFNFGKPPMTKTVGTFNVMYDLGNGKIGDSLEDIGIGESKSKTLLGSTGKTLATAGTDLGKETILLAHKIELKVTRTRPRTNTPDVRPWVNSKKTLVDLRLTAAMPLRVVLELVVRHFAKSVGGASDEQIDESKLKDEIKDALLDTLKTTVEDTAIQGTEPLLNCTIGQLLKENKGFQKFMGGLGFLKQAYNEAYTFEDDMFKTLRFTFSNGRFVSFSMSDDYDTDAKLEIKPLPFLGIELGLSSHTSVNDYTIFRKATANMFMDAASDYATAGNMEGFKNFLVRHQNHVVRIIQAGKENAQNVARPDDKYWTKDCESMSKIMRECDLLLNSLATQQNEIGEEARNVRAIFDAVVHDVKQQADDMEPADVLNLANRFFRTTANIYTLAAMANIQVPQNNVQAPQNNGQVPVNNDQVPQNDDQVPQNDDQVPQNDDQVPQNDVQAPQNDV
ncbi:MAG: hypothetical protein IKX30_18555 [Victivallales bacterium]|nr:hypothetical protein [Victivallales bacterium]